MLYCVVFCIVRLCACHFLIKGYLTWLDLKVMSEDNGCQETPHRPHRPPKNRYILSIERRLFLSHFLSSVPSFDSAGTLTVNSVPSRGRKPHQRKRPATDRTTTTSKRRAVADYAASACNTGVNWLCDEISLLSILKIYLFWGPVRTVRPARCFVTPEDKWAPFWDSVAKEATLPMASPTLLKFRRELQTTAKLTSISRYKTLNFEDREIAYSDSAA